MKQVRKIYLDMDGTIADLYGQAEWLEKLRSEDENVFKDCEPLITETKLLSELHLAFGNNIQVVILSMTPKGATKEYCEQVIDQKNEWLDTYFPTLTKRIYKPYGHNKNLKNSRNTILIDDSKPIRENYRGIALVPWWC